MHRYTLGVGVLALSLATINTSHAQVRIQVQPDLNVQQPMASDSALAGMSLPTDRRASEQIGALKQYILKENPPWELIVDTAQKLLESEQDSLLDMMWKDDAGQTHQTKVSVRAEVNRLIGTLPPEGMEFYENTFGPRAQALLAQAKDERDPEILADLSQRYLHTTAGGEATRLLGNFYLDRGRYQEAASCYNRLLERRDADQLDPMTIFYASVAFKRADDAKAEQIWDRFTEAAREKIPRPAGREVTLDQFRNEFERRESRLFAALDSWAMYRGAANRNGTGIGSSPFLDPRFTREMTPLSSLWDVHPGNVHPDKIASEWIDQKVDQALEALQNKNTPVIPSFHPIAVNGKIIFRDYRGVTAVYTEPTIEEGEQLLPGDVAWYSNSFFGAYELVNTENEARIIGGSQWWMQYQASGPQGILFENGLIGTLSHDGRCVYYVDDMAIPPHPQFAAGINQRGNNLNFTLDPPSHGDPIRHNRLVALDIDGGSVRWSLGGEANDPKPRDEGQPWTHDDLQDSHFLGVPLPVSDRLYVVMEKEGKLYLLCLDPPELAPLQRGLEEQKPRIVWVQPLGTPNFSIDRDTLRRIQGVNLSFADGILVVPTNAGVILGVELATRSLLWAHSYRGEWAKDDEPDETQKPGGRVIGGRGIAMPFQPAPNVDLLNQERWRGSAPIITQGKIVFTAYDSNVLQCLDLRTGKIVWNIPREAKDLYLAGVIDGKVIVVGKDAIRALDMENAKQLWTLTTGLPAGHGVTSDGNYYLPIKAAYDSKAPEVWQIRLADGKIMARTKSRKREEPGNLVFYKGDVYSQTVKRLVAYPQLQRQLEEMDRRLAKNPTDPVGLTERGALRLDKGELLSAVTDLQTALGNDPELVTQVRARQKLYEALTELFQRDFDKAETYLPEYQELCKLESPEKATPEKREELKQERQRRQGMYLSLMGTGREKQGRLVEAFDHYLAFGTLHASGELVDVPDDPSTSTRPDVWARGRIEEMLRRAAPENRKPVEERISSKWTDIQEKGDLTEIRGFVAVFGGMSAAGQEAKLILAEKLVNGGDASQSREAELLLAGLRAESETMPEVAAQATEALARLFVNKARAGDEALFHDAVAFYDELGEKFADTPVRDGKTGADFLNDLLTDKRFLPYLEPVRQVWEKRLRGRTINTRQTRTTNSSFTLHPEGDLLPFYDRHRLIIDINVGGSAGWQLRVEDRVTGETKSKFPGLPVSQYLYHFQQNNFRFAKAHGHIMLLNINNMVFAFDLAEGKKLWEYNLFGKLVLPPNVRPRAEQRPDGLWLVYPDGWVQKAGQLGAITSSYVCLQTHDGLVALDPARGTTLWTKSDVQPRVELFGDESHVFIQEFGADSKPLKTRAVRSRDGANVDVPDISSLFQPGTDLRIDMTGRTILATNANKSVVRLYDALSGEDQWKTELPEGAILVRGQDLTRVGFITKEGEMKVLNSRTGEVEYEAKLDDPEKYLKDVEDARILADGERYFLFLNQARNNQVSATPCLSNGLRSTPVNGPVFCFDQATGERRWIADLGQFENQYLLLEQFDDLPVLIGAVQFFQAQGNTRKQGTTVIALDKQTGLTVYNETLTRNSHFYAMTSNAKKGEIELIRYDLRVRLSLEEEGEEVGANVEEQPNMNAPGIIRGRAVPVPVQRAIVPAVQPVLPVQRNQRVPVPVPEKKE